MDQLATLKQKTSLFNYPHVIIVGGPAGCGKSTIGQQLSELLNTTFIEGDNLHSEHNVDKMAHGIPLTDEDREPWLRQISKTGTEAAIAHNNLSIVSCSMLKRKYRELLIHESPNTKFIFVFVYTTFDELVKRVTNRPNHYMKNDMVKSQYDIMEIPSIGEGIPINVQNLTKEQVLDVVLQKLSLYL